MPQRTATIESLPMAFEVVKAMQADGLEWGEGYPAAVTQDLVQRASQAVELRVGKEPLAFALGVQRDGTARIAAPRRHGPLPGKGKHMAQRLHRRVRHGGGLAETLVQIHDVPALHRCQRELAEGRYDVAVDDAARRALRLRLAVDRNMLLEIAPGEVGDRARSLADIEAALRRIGERIEGAFPVARVQTGVLREEGTVNKLFVRERGTQIASSRFGVVVLSRVFFGRGWTEYELDGLAGC